MRFLVLQHLDVEHPGIFREFMHAEGIAFDTVELDAGESIPPLDDYAALIVMGGPMDVWEEDQHPWLVAEKQVIRQSVRHDQRPFLGACLGHQLLGAALGGDVARAARAEVGVMAVTLTAAGAAHAFFAGAPGSFKCLQWHGAEIVTAPREATVLASSALCPVQALAVGRHAFSFQFHVEVIATTVDDWYAIPAYRDSLHETLGNDGAQQFRDDTRRNMNDFNRLARVLYNNWREHAFGVSAA